MRASSWCVGKRRNSAGRRLPRSRTEILAWHGGCHHRRGRLASRDIGARGVDRLTEIFAGATPWGTCLADPPSHDQRATAQCARRLAVARAVVRSGVRPGLRVVGGVSAPGPKHAYVRRAGPDGVLSCLVQPRTVLVEKLLDRIETDHRRCAGPLRARPDLPAQQRHRDRPLLRRPLLPARLLRFQRIPVIPSHPALRMQAVHADDVADAYARVLKSDLRGAFNVAAGPVLDPALAAEIFHGVQVPVPGWLLHAAASLSWRARLQPVDAGGSSGLRAP